jgi:hypothetical protein
MSDEQDEIYIDLANVDPEVVKILLKMTPEEKLAFINQALEEYVKEYPIDELEP